MLKFIRSLVLLNLISFQVLAETPSNSIVKPVVARLPVNEAFVLEQSAGKVFHLTLGEGEYLRGDLKADHPFDAIISMGNGHVVRQVSQPHSRDARIFFQAKTEGTYQLRIVAGVQETTFNLRLNSVPLMTEGIKPTPVLISDAMQNAFKALQQGGAPDAIWQQLTRNGTPLIETLEGVNDKLRVTFLWRGAKERVLMLGAPGYNHDPLYRLGDSDIWYRSYDLPSDTRISYQLAPDVPQVAAGGREQRIAILATAQRDPENPNQWAPDGVTDIYGVKSILELKDAPSDDALKDQQSIEKVAEYALESHNLGNTRAVDIWVSEELRQLAPGKMVPLAIFFDGKAYQSKVPTPRILHNLVAENKIPPLVAVFVNNPSNSARIKELPCNPDFADFMAEELLPFVRQKTGYRFSAGQTLLAGSSFGGLASSCTALRYPELFGKVLSLSGSYWWSPSDSDRPEWLPAHFAEVDKKPIQFYLSAGRFETNYGESGILSSNRHFEQVLRLKGYLVKLEEFSSGHDYFHWRATLDRGLIHLLGKR
ncbi:alpha/beta hydrolase-fold protein [Oceanospirillum linum]|uniref:Enterochelin esterase N-terminal domain-containing protein n=1 Tax=Oceanospirillum linum TaxID=966 RepID=A0A1T1H9V8_OCELI|nr:alpha/beta hydrolase-fold protein [Oceanospirillum linum]OOV86651.1 hypothetical protein BTA35_0212235 [Oceanospirillum linum]SEG27276.1 enterochelin esterase [Oleiphilus messinensis]SMP27466.1 enterochelin esterase [Oceanospirillum linum]